MACEQVLGEIEIGKIILYLLLNTTLGNEIIGSPVMRGSQLWTMLKKKF